MQQTLTLLPDGANRGSGAHNHKPRAMQLNPGQPANAGQGAGLVALPPVVGRDSRIADTLHGLAPQRSRDVLPRRLLALLLLRVPRLLRPLKPQHFGKKVICTLLF